MGSQRTLFEPLRRLDPERIGSYVLLGRLGAGAIGRVYLGRSAAGRLGAGQTMQIEFPAEEDFRARFAPGDAAARRGPGAYTRGAGAAALGEGAAWAGT